MLMYSREWFEQNICSISGVQNIKVNVEEVGKVVIDVVLAKSANAEEIANAINQRVEKDTLCKYTFTLLQPHSVKVVETGF